MLPPVPVMMQTFPESLFGIPSPRDSGKMADGQ
jgi:hypothetical protein